VSLVREISAEVLFEVAHDPFVRHQVDRRTVERTWQRGDAVVVQGGRHRNLNVRPGPVLTCLGRPDDLVPLLHAVASSLDAPPGRVTIEREAAPDAPWAYEYRREWDWMWTREPPVVVPRHRVVEVDDPVEIDGLLDVANPDSFARPGTPGVEAWLGVRTDGGRLLGAGALERMADGTGHLRGVSVLPEASGRGIGYSVSHGLTVHALSHAGSGVATLGVYSDNEAALSIYRQLGYTTAHRFCSGPVASPHI